MLPSMAGFMSIPLNLMGFSRFCSWFDNLTFSFFTCLFRLSKPSIIQTSSILSFQCYLRCAIQLLSTPAKYLQAIITLSKKVKSTDQVVIASTDLLTLCSVLIMNTTCWFLIGHNTNHMTHFTLCFYLWQFVRLK